MGELSMLVTRIARGDEHGYCFVIPSPYFLSVVSYTDSACYEVGIEYL